MLHINGKFAGKLKGELNLKPIKIAQILEKTATKGKHDSSCKVYVPPEYKDKKVYILITEEVYQEANKGKK